MVESPVNIGHFLAVLWLSLVDSDPRLQACFPQQKRGFRGVPAPEKPCSSVDSSVRASDWEPSGTSPSAPSPRRNTSASSSARGTPRGARSTGSAGTSAAPAPTSPDSWPRTSTGTSACVRPFGQRQGPECILPTTTTVRAQRGRCGSRSGVGSLQSGSHHGRQFFEPMGRAFHGLIGRRQPRHDRERP